MGVDYLKKNLTKFKENRYKTKSVIASYLSEDSNQKRKIFDSTPKLLSAAVRIIRIKCHLNTIAMVICN